MTDSTRRVLRTALAAFLGICAMMPLLVSAAGLDPAELPWLAGILAVTAAITRVMALPAVDQFLATYLPWLAKNARDGRHEAGRDGDAGWARSPLVLVLGLAAVVVLAVPASAGPWQRPRPHQPSSVVPEILGGAVGCGDAGRTYLRTRQVLEVSPGVWQARPGGPAVGVQGWFDGRWRDATVLAVTDTGVLVREGLYRWRPVLRDRGRTVVGPDWYLTSDLCSEQVNEMARQAGVA